MISDKNIRRITLAAAIIAWLGLLITDMLVLFSYQNRMSPGATLPLSKALLIVFVVFAYIHFTYRISSSENLNLVDLLWKVFATGLVATLLSLGISFLFIIFKEQSLLNNVFVINLFYHFNLAAILVFILSTSVVFKRLIFYHKNKFLLRIWNIFRYSILMSMFLNFFEISKVELWLFVFLVGQTFLIIVLAVNLKWVAYLNFKQKWRSLLLLLLTLVYLYYFFNYMVTSSNDWKLVTDLFQNLFVLVIFSFVLIYSVFAFLVILFNLPTSSVFEQKFDDVLNFQRLSQSMQVGKNERQVLEVLIDSAVAATMADAAYLQINKVDENGLLRHHIAIKDIKVIDQVLEEEPSRRFIGKNIGLKAGKPMRNIDHAAYKSALIIPLESAQENIGRLVLLKEVKDAFNKEMADLVGTFVIQASVSIQNFRLVDQALENERYKEELKIAKSVQASLLPQKLVHNDKFEIRAFSLSADEVGGDYYDIFQISESKFALVIADVSGKGTTAAFHMAQLKGVFHSLAQQGLGPREFLLMANSALSQCLEKNMFITLSYYVIDTEKGTVEFSRAGHCPTLFYCEKEKEANFFKNNGLGLGIVRSGSYGKYIEVNSFSVNPDDMLVLYTDGVAEARNKKGEEYGYERLAEYINSHAKGSLKDIQDGMLTNLHAFSSEERLSDDYTCVIIRFK